jgi:hypothetical protein
MAVYMHAEYDLLEQLRTDGWIFHDMSAHKNNLSEVVAWCRKIFGDMLVIYDRDFFVCRWHGSTIKTGNGDVPVFVFRNAADLTLLQLRWV